MTTKKEAKFRLENDINTDDEFSIKDLRPVTATINREKLRHIVEVVDRLGIPITYETPVCVPVSLN